jgi:hypothetical protein
MQVRMNEQSELYAAVYEAVQASVALECCLPAATANVQRALTRFRGGDAVRQLETMSVLLHQLTAASLRQESDMRAVALSKLDLAAREWMHRLPLQ